MPPLITAVVARDTAQLGPTFAGPYINARPTLDIAPQRAPDPIRAGDTPSRPARMPVWLYTAIGAFQSVSQMENYIRLWAPPPSADQPKGTMTPDTYRGNIRREMPDVYGSQFTMEPGEQDELLAGMP